MINNPPFQANLLFILLGLAVLGLFVYLVKRVEINSAAGSWSGNWLVFGFAVVALVVGWLIGATSWGKKMASPVLETLGAQVNPPDIPKPDAATITWDAATRTLTFPAPPRSDLKWIVQEHGSTPQVVATTGKHVVAAGRTHCLVYFQTETPVPTAGPAELKPLP